MINLFNASIESLSVHKVGNKSRNEPIFLSDAPLKLSDEILPLLKEYFFKPFREKEENYFRFAHDVDLDYHSLKPLISLQFGYGDLAKEQPGKDQMHLISQKIAHLLYEQHNHPHIKSGELYVAYITNVTIDNQPCDAIGIFKSEIKNDFMQIEEPIIAYTNLPKTEYQKSLQINLLQGISLDKLDKGALIFNVQAKEGYKILCLDQNRYDARYWLEHFLSVDIFEDEHFLTKKYMKMVQDFGHEVVLPAEDKKSEVLFTNKAFNYFAKNDEFEETAFLNEVLDNPDFIPEFKNFKVEKGLKYSVEDVSSFPISNSAVTDARKKFKPLIKLDTGVEIKINITNPDAAEKVIEKGWDEEKQMYYYLVYFNKEER